MTRTALARRGFRLPLAALAAGLLALSCGEIIPPSQYLAGGPGSWLTPSGNALRQEVGALSDTAAPGDASASGEGASGSPVEPDVYAFDRDNYRLYAANAHRGLVAFDIIDPDKPALLGRLPVRGSPKELYLSGGSLVLLLDPAPGTYGYGYTAADTEAANSSVLFIDPTTIGGGDVASPPSLELGGTILDSRLVGDSLIVVTNEYGWSTGSGADTGQDDVATSPTIGVSASIGSWQATVHVIDVSARTLDSTVIPGTCSAIHVASDAVFVARQDSAWSSALTSHILRWDIDASGSLVDRGSVEISGYIADRFKLDWKDRHLRVIAFDPGLSWSTRTTRVFSIDWSDPASPDSGEDTRSIEVGAGESLYASRFDGELCYPVTFLTTDPLFAISFADPDRPVELAALKDLPGYSTHIIPVAGPAGERWLFAVGADAGTKVALFDASDPANLHQLGSDLGIGDAWSWSSATWDWKRINALPELEAFALPYWTWDGATGAGSANVAIVGYGGGIPELICGLPDTGDVERTIPYATDRAYTYAADRLLAWKIGTAPDLLSTLAIAEDVAWAGQAGTLGVKLVRDGSRLLVRSFDPAAAALPGCIAEAVLPEAAATYSSWTWWDIASATLEDSAGLHRLHLLGSSWDSATRGRRLTLASFVIGAETIVAESTVTLPDETAWSPFPGGGARILGTDEGRLYVFNGGLAIVDLATRVEVDGVAPRGACAAFLHDDAVDLFIAKEDFGHGGYMAISLETWDISAPEASVRSLATSFPGWPLFRDPSGEYIAAYIPSWERVETRILGVGVVGGEAVLRGETLLEDRLAALAPIGGSLAFLAGGWWYGGYAYALADTALADTALAGPTPVAGRMAGRAASGGVTLGTVTARTAAGPAVAELASFDSGSESLVANPPGEDPPRVAAIVGSRAVILREGSGVSPIEVDFELPGSAGWYVPGASLADGTLCVGLSWAGVALRVLEP